MTTRTSRADGQAIAYVPRASSQSEIGAAIQCILEGRPFPPHLRPQPLAIAAPRTLEEGFGRILRGGR